MNLINNTSLQIRCIINDNEVFVIPPSEKIDIDVEDSTVAIKILHLYDSYLGTRFELDDMYHIVLNTSLTVIDVEAASDITITGELVHFELGYVYDCFFCCAENCSITKNEILLSDLKCLYDVATIGKKRDSFGERISMFLLSGGFWASTALFILFKMGFWTNDWAFPWWIIIIFWILGYGIQTLGEICYYNYIRKKQPKVRELQKYASVEYIMEYYCNPNRVWIGDDRKPL